MALDISEFQKEQRSADRIDRHRAELFRSLIKTEGWQEYIRLVEAKIQGFSDQLLMPAGSLDGLVATEYVKGAMSGLIMARDIASATIAAIAELRPAQAEDDDDGSE